MANYAGWFNSAVNNGLVRGIDPSSPEFAAAQAQGNQYNSQFAYNGHNSIMPVAPGQGGGYSQGYGGNMGYGGYGGGGGGGLYGGAASVMSFGGGGGYGGVNPAVLQSLYTNYQNQYNEAKAANLARYNQVVSGYGSLHDRSMNYLQGQGTAETANINERYNNMNQGQLQNMTDRGLSNSTLVSNAQNAVGRERSLALQNLNESLNRQYLGTDQSTTQLQLGAVERRQDPYPDQNMITNLALQLGRSGYGGAGGYGAQYPTGSSSSMFYHPTAGIGWTPGQAAAAYKSNSGAGGYQQYGAFV